MKTPKYPRSYAVYNDQGIFIHATRSEASSIKTAKEFAKKSGESYIMVAKARTYAERRKPAKVIHRLKCVLRFGKNEEVRCPYRSGKHRDWPKKCQKIARVRCHPVRSIPRPVKFGKKRKKR